MGHSAHYHLTVHLTDASQTPHRHANLPAWIWNTSAASCSSCSTAVRAPSDAHTKCLPSCSSVAPPDTRRYARTSAALGVATEADPPLLLACCGCREGDLAAGALAAGALAGGAGPASSSSEPICTPYLRFFSGRVEAGAADAEDAALRGAAAVCAGGVGVDVEGARASWATSDREEGRASADALAPALLLLLLPDEDCKRETDRNKNGEVEDEDEE